MSIRTVRLDHDTEKVLLTIMQATGLSISEAVKKGLRMLEKKVPKQEHTPYEIYQQLELAPANPQAPHARDAHKILREMFKQKLAQKRGK